jgi:hypothetical protein
LAGSAPTTLWLVIFSFSVLSAFSFKPDAFVRLSYSWKISLTLLLVFSVMIVTSSAYTMIFGHVKLIVLLVTAVIVLFLLCSLRVVPLPV